MGTVVMVRHGETDWNAERRVQGWAPSGLNDRGRRQARALSDHLAARYDIDRIVASDLRRTTETVREIRRALGDATRGSTDAPPVEFSPAWRERDFGVLQGLSYESLFEGYPEFSVLESGVAGARAGPEDGESWLELRTRILDAWASLVEDASDETVLVVTHGGPIHVVIGLLRGYDIVETVVEIELDNCALTEVDVTGDPSLRRACEAAFLEPESVQD
jgi:probable phosphoglycerate mutase